jgi:crotonobetaine/carnitine-CoA ligase
VILRALLGRDAASLPELWAARVERTPDALFLAWRGRVWSYRDAWLEIRRFAGYLEAVGLARTGARVGTYLGNCPEAIWAWFGTLAAGCQLVSLNRNHKGEILRDMIVRSRPRIMVTDELGLDQLGQSGHLPFEKVVVAGDPLSPSLAVPLVPYHDVARSAPFLAPFPDPYSLATIMFTSGTTGHSKAAKLPHTMFSRGAARVAERCGFRSSDVFHCWMPLYHIAGQLHIVTAMVAAGGSVALVPSFSGTRFWDEVHQSRATLFAGMPNTLRILHDRPPRPAGDRSTLRVGLVGICPKDLHRSFEERFGVTIYDSYGMTEMEPLTLPDPARRSPVGSVGVAGPDFELAIQDSEGECLAPGTIGEIVARPRAPGLMMQGYENDDLATLAAWRNLWWHTGDLGRIDSEGFVYIEGRIKEMIRRRGENISVSELEGVLKAHPEVVEVAAVGVPSPLGEEDVKVVVVLRPGSRMVPAELHAFCRAAVAFFMVPRFIEIRDALPFSFIGKVDRERLKTASPLTWDAESEAALPGPDSGHRPTPRVEQDQNSGREGEDAHQDAES